VERADSELHAHTLSNSPEVCFNQPQRARARQGQLRPRSSSRKDRSKRRSLITQPARSGRYGNVLDGAGTICGRISVPPEEARDLLAHCKDAAPRSNAPAPAAARGKQNPVVSAMLAAAKRHPLSRAAILRGC
jgi:FAD/FMN-containing dehydrogenase